MTRLLLVVEDAVEISGPKLVVAPGPLEAEYNGPRQLEVTLISPTQTRRNALMTLESLYNSSAPANQRWACVLDNLSRREVPTGTQVWIAD